MLKQNESAELLAFDRNMGLAQKLVEKRQLIDEELEQHLIRLRHNKADAFNFINDLKMSTGYFLPAWWQEEKTVSVDSFEAKRRAAVGKRKQYQRLSSNFEQKLEKGSTLLPSINETSDLLANRIRTMNDQEFSRLLDRIDNVNISPWLPNYESAYPKATRLGDTWKHREDVEMEMVNELKMIAIRHGVSGPQARTFLTRLFGKRHIKAMQKPNYGLEIEGLSDMEKQLITKMGQFRDANPTLPELVMMVLPKELAEEQRKIIEAQRAAEEEAAKRLKSKVVLPEPQLPQRLAPVERNRMIIRKSLSHLPRDSTNIPFHLPGESSSLSLLLPTSKLDKCKQKSSRKKSNIVHVDTKLGERI